MSVVDSKLENLNLYMLIHWQWYWNWYSTNATSI